MSWLTEMADIVKITVSCSVKFIPSRAHQHLGHNWPTALLETLFQKKKMRSQSITNQPINCYKSKQLAELLVFTIQHVDIRLQQVLSPIGSGLLRGTLVTNSQHVSRLHAAGAQTLYHVAARSFTMCP